MCSVSDYNVTATIDPPQDHGDAMPPRKKTAKKRKATKRAAGTTGGLVRLNFFCRPEDQEYIDAIKAATALGSESQVLRFAIKMAFDRLETHPPKKPLEKQKQVRSKRGERVESRQKVLWLAVDDVERLERVIVLSGYPTLSDGVRRVLKQAAKRLAVK